MNGGINMTGTIVQMHQESQKTAVIVIDGHKVRLHFAPEPSESAMDNVRELLIRSLVGAPGIEKRPTDMDCPPKM